MNNAQKNEVGQMDRGLEDLSETAQSVIKHKTNFVEQWSLLIFVLLFTALVYGTSFIEYPYIVDASAVVGDNVVGEQPNWKLSQSCYAQIKIPKKNGGEVLAGMEVQLILDGYSNRDHGIIIGKLISISNERVDDDITGTVFFSNGLISNKNKRISFSKGLTGHAIIIVKRSMLLDRLYKSVFPKTSF